jgi:excisionase family DNA binding protein
VNWISAHTRQALGWMSRSTQVMRAGLLLTAMVVFAQTASQWIDFRLFDLRLAVLDSDHHASVFGAMSILAQAVAAAAIGLRAVSTRRPALLLVAALVGVLTVPRALMRYEPAFERYDVPILVAPLTVACVVLCALTFRDGRRVRCIVWGSLVLLACSFALHAVGPQADADGSTAYLAHTWAYQVTGMLKHGAELAGWMLLATGMAAVASPPMEDGLLTVNDIAALLKLNQETVRTWIDSGFLPAIRIGRRIRIKRADFDRLLDASCTGNKSASDRIWSGNVPGPDVPSD